MKKAIEEIPLLTPEQAQKVCVKALKLPRKLITDFENGSRLECVGYPLYYKCHTMTQPETSQIDRHHKIIQTEFRDLLDAIKTNLETLLNIKILTRNDVPLPGFHIITCASGLLPINNFHSDRHNLEALSHLPDLKISPNPRFFSFTLMLSHDLDLEAGLQHLAPPLDIKRKKMLAMKPALKSLLSDLLIYKPGHLYIHTEDFMHNIFANNLGKKALERITFQGHLTETKDGFLMWW